MSKAALLQRLLQLLKLSMTAHGALAGRMPPAGRILCRPALQRSGRSAVYLPTILAHYYQAQWHIEVKFRSGPTINVAHFSILKFSCKNLK